MELKGDIAVRILEERRTALSRRAEEHQARTRQAQEEEQKRQEEERQRSRLEAPIRTRNTLLRHRSTQWQNKQGILTSSRDFKEVFLLNPADDELRASLILDGKYRAAGSRAGTPPKILVPTLVSLRLVSGNDGDTITEHDIACQYGPSLDDGGMPMDDGLYCPDDPEVLLAPADSDFVLGALNEALRIENAAVQRERRERHIGAIPTSTPALASRPAV